METIDSLIVQNIDDFIKDFENASKKLYYNPESKRFIHPGEFGTYREKICKRFIRPFVPNNFEIGTGFVVNNTQEISTQCDIIVYDKDSTPLISDYNNNHFFTVETVAAIGEVKSVLTKQDLKVALNKLARCKKLREKIKEPSVLKQKLKIDYNPESNHYDNIISFLICEKLNFDSSELISELNELYEEDIEPRFKHNMILSLNDGLYTYYSITNDDPITIQYPVLNTYQLKNLQITDAKKYIPFKLFSSYLLFSLLSVTTLFPDLVQYLGSFESQTLKYE